MNQRQIDILQIFAEAGQLRSRFSLAESIRWKKYPRVWLIQNGVSSPVTFPFRKWTTPTIQNKDLFDIHYQLYKSI